ncbi:MAG: type II toxin-antitoxin system RelE/ParE family toxin [Methylobacter sp.]|nr:type II toxin-antitoxin system RelE/ParE family toxin [Candidatus Methylobacter titanis]
MILRWLPRAIADRDAQLDFIAQDNISAAIEQGDRIEAHVMRLVEHPKIGRAGRKKGTRELVVSRTAFIVVYRIDDENQIIQILRLLHGAQQWPPEKNRKSV